MSTPKRQSHVTVNAKNDWVILTIHWEPLTSDITCRWCGETHQCTELDPARTDVHRLSPIGAIELGENFLGIRPLTYAVKLERDDLLQIGRDLISAATAIAQTRYQWS